MSDIFLQGKEDEEQEEEEGKSNTLLSGSRSMTQKSQSHQKQQKIVIGDVYGVVVLPKNIELDNKPCKLQLQIQAPVIGKVLKGFLRTREVCEFLSGALAGVMAKGVLAPLETIRTRMVVGVGPKNIIGNFVDIIEQQGWQGLWAGNTVNMLRIIPSQAIELGTFECVKREMTSAQEKWNQAEDTKLQIGHVTLQFSLSWISPAAVAGAAAGVVSTLACHPLEVVKDRLTVRPEDYQNITLALGKIYKEGGLGALYAGISPTLMGMLPYSTCYYFMYDTLKKSHCVRMKKTSLNRGEMLLVGALSGLTASTISFPLEVARKRLMVGALRGKCPANLAAALSEVVQEEGLMGLYRGWGASCLKVMPNSGITWMFYEAWKDILLVERQHS